MSKFVFSFRAQQGRTSTAAEEAEWGKWFQKLGPAVVDMGNRVGQSRHLGSNGVLGGYILVEAKNFESAVDLAKGCPGLEHGAGIEVGEVVPSPRP